MLKRMNICGEKGEIKSVEDHNAFEPNLPAIKRHYPDAKYLEFEVWDQDTVAGGSWCTVATVYLTSGI